MSDADRAAPYDVTVAGGNYIGLTLALALLKAAPTTRVAVIEPRSRAALAADGRASAIAAAGRRLYEALGVWPDLETAASPILRMDIGDGRREDAIRPTFLTFEADADGPLAHMLTNAHLVATLGEAVRAAGAELIEADAVADFTPGPGRTDVVLVSGRRLTSRLLVAADGARSRLRALSGIATIGWSYAQAAVTATIAHDRPHAGLALEMFLPSGPIATLPLADSPDGRPRSSLVWSDTRERAERLGRTDAFVFESELGRHLGGRFGALTLAGRRSVHPLSLTLARDFVRPRLALIGDAAHAIHPVAGQGLNLGLGDAAALAEVLVEALRAGRDIGAFDVLEDYQRWRRFEALRMAATTDALTRLFSNDIAPLRLMRDVGLGLVDRVPPLKRLFAGKAAGGDGRQPKLLAGLAL